MVNKNIIVGKGVYANRNFKQGEIVIKYNLKSLIKDEYKKLSKQEKIFTHIHFGSIQLYSKPEMYVNHYSNPNIYQDLINSLIRGLFDLVK